MPRELINRSDDTNDGEFAWRGHPYFDEIDLALPSTFEFGEGVTDSQRCWVGYLPSTDEFIAGYDLWLANEAGERAGDDCVMAGGLVTLRLTIHDEALAVTVVKAERFPKTIYEEDTLDVIGSRYPDCIEVDID